MASSKTTPAIVGLTIVAAIVDGLLAGGNVDRAVVAMPAWHHLSVTDWANFSRYADLGNGAIVYPLMALGGTLFSAIAAALFLWTGRSVRCATFPILLSASLMLASLPVSFLAVPYMQSLRHLSNDDVVALRRAFSGFEYWGHLQGALHVGAFCANLWSVFALGHHKDPAQASLN